jgi:ribonuclease HIII
MNLKDKALLHLKTYRELLTKSGIVVDNILAKEFNYEFNATKGSNRVKVLVYFGKKGIKVILQGDLESKLHKTIDNIINDQQSLDLGNSNFMEPAEYIGSDEVGKGDFFGPLVIAAVFVNQKSKKELSKIGVRDSKDISDYQIKDIAREIQSIVKENIEIVRINPAKYNELYAKFKNLNKLLNWGHSKAIDNLLDNTKCKYVITDKFSKKNLDVVTLAKHSDVDFVQETKAEKYIGVAAASILARAAFLEWFDFQERKGLKIPRGSSEQVEIYARQLVKKIGEDKLSELVKIHFKTFNKIKLG